MSDLTIVTNRVPRDVTNAWELPESARSEFDYISDWESTDSTFVQYRGAWYDLGDFMSTHSLGAPDAFKAWDGYASDSFFSGVLVRYTSDYEQVVMATYIS